MRTFGKDYSALYDSVYHDKNYQSECDFLESIWHDSHHEVKTILDIGCGTGGHAIELAKRGYSVTGIDISSEMLANAKLKAESSGLAIDYHLGDAKDFTIPRKFDAAISMFAVMGYQHDNTHLKMAIENAWRHLKRGAPFIFDIWHGSAVLSEGLTPRCKITRENEETILRFTESSLDAEQQCVDVEFTFIKMGKNNTASMFKESHRVRYLFPQELKLFCSVAGFSEIEIHPFGQRGCTVSKSDWNICACAKKPQK